MITRFVAIVLQIALLLNFIQINCLAQESDNCCRFPPITLFGGVICPEKPQSNIRLNRMEINIQLKQNSYVVDSTFYLFNNGDTTELKVGLPKHGKHDDPMYIAAHGRKVIIRDFIHMESWLDGEKVSFFKDSDFMKVNNLYFFHDYRANRSASLKQVTQWLVRSIKFTGKDTTIIRIRYEASYFCVCYNWPSSIGIYYLGTGHFWHGNVSSCVFVIDKTELDPKNIIQEQVSLSNILITDKITTFEVANFEPPLGIQLRFGLASEIHRAIERSRAH